MNMSPNDPTPATCGALFEVFQLLSDKIDEKHKNTRDTLEHVLTRIEGRMDSHDRDDRIVADRLLKIEVERIAERSELGREKARVLRDADMRVGVFSLLVSTVVTIALWVLTRVFTK